MTFCKIWLEYSSVIALCTCRWWVDHCLPGRPKKEAESCSLHICAGWHWEWEGSSSPNQHERGQWHPEKDTGWVLPAKALLRGEAQWPLCLQHQRGGSAGSKLWWLQKCLICDQGMRYMNEAVWLHMVSFCVINKKFLTAVQAGGVCLVWQCGTHQCCWQPTASRWGYFYLASLSGAVLAAHAVCKSGILQVIKNWRWGTAWERGWAVLCWGKWKHETILDIVFNSTFVLFRGLHDISTSARIGADAKQYSGCRYQPGRLYSTAGSDNLQLSWKEV